DWGLAEARAKRELRKSGAVIRGEGTTLDKDREELVITLVEAYEAYREAGGNRTLPPRVLAALGEVDIDLIARAFLLAAATKICPRCTEAERAGLVIDPVAEIVGSPRPKVSASEKARLDRHRLVDAQYQAERDLARLEAAYAKEKKYR